MCTASVCSILGVCVCTASVCSTLGVCVCVLLVYVVY